MYSSQLGSCVRLLGLVAVGAIQGVVRLEAGSDDTLSEAVSALDPAGQEGALCWEAVYFDLHTDEFGTDDTVPVIDRHPNAPSVVGLNLHELVGSIVVWWLLSTEQ